MKLEWQIKPSKICTVVIVLLSIMPVIIAISMGQSSQMIGLVILLSSLMFFLLFRSTNLTSRYPSKKLTWEDEHWSFNNKELTITGVQSKYSFSLELMLFLSIESEDGQRIALWLFPDNIMSKTVDIETTVLQSSRETRVETRQIKWRHLHCCFHLSS
ncbi:MAG: hypothetical protein ACI9IA_000632 [Enterobacterales bacterium]|jgi:hypothetical protein